MQAKTLERQSKKFEKEMNDYKKKVKKEMEKGNLDVARVYAETAIHKKSLATKMLQMSSKIDAVSMKLKAQLRQKETVKMISKLNKDLDVHIKSMNIEGMSRTMDIFEKQFEDIDIATKVMEKGMDKGTSTLMNENQVVNLLNEIADEHNMDIKDKLEDAGIANKPINVKQKNKEKIEEKEEDNKLSGLMSI